MGPQRGQAAPRVLSAPNFGALPLSHPQTVLRGMPVVREIAQWL